MPGASDSLVGDKCLPEVGLCTGMPCWGAPIICMATLSQHLHVKWQMGLNNDTKSQNPVH